MIQLFLMPLGQFLIARSAREDRAWAAAAFLAQWQTKERVCSFVRPGQRRAIPGAPGSAYFVVARR